MGLVRNLKKRFNNWVDRTLAELSSAYIKQLAKQTSKKRDNCSSMESLPNHLTTVHPDTIIATSSPDTSEKIIMETKIEPVAQIREWAIKRLEEAESIGAKAAIYEEFEDWIELEEKEELEYLALEDMGWGDQEVDVR